MNDLAFSILWKSLMFNCNYSCLKKTVIIILISFSFFTPPSRSEYLTEIVDFSEVCRFCSGKGNVTVVIGADETEVSQCVNCEGIGSLPCTTCQGTGIQPRYLDRR
jgi:hypothetical protein